MKYTYAYRTSDGVRHEAAMDAESREAVFVALRAKGIRAIKVVAADGSKANGEDSPSPGLRGAGPGIFRIAFSFLVLAAALAGGAAWWAARQPGAPRQGSAGGRGGDALQEFLTSRTRRQVIGDAAVVEKGIATGWADVFEHEGERFLASFAVPGVRAGQRSTTVEEIEAALGRSVGVAESDGLEARQIKAMVEGMKAEARAYVAAGGSVVGYGRRLTERQDAEIAIYERAKADFEAAKKSKKSEDELVAYWESLNDRLRNLGIRPVSLEE